LFAKILRFAKRWRVPLAGATLVLLLLLLYPFQITVVSRWRLHVVDETGAPLRGAKVTEHWRHYLFESEDHQALLRSDQGGLVEFPERAIRAGIASRFIRRLFKLPWGGVAAKYEPGASVVVWGNSGYGTAVAVYNPDAPPTTEVVVPRARTLR
jgi:hypothetical protein